MPDSSTQFAQGELLPGCRAAICIAYNPRAIAHVVSVASIGTQDLVSFRVVKRDTGALSDVIQERWHGDFTRI